MRALQRSKKLGFLGQQESQVEPQLDVAQLEVAQAGAAHVGAAQAGSQQSEDLRNLALIRSQKLGLGQQSDPHESQVAPQPPTVPPPQPPGMGVETIGPDAGGAAWTASPALTDVSSRKSTFTGVFLRGSGD